MFEFKLFYVVEASKIWIMYQKNNFLIIIYWEVCLTFP